MVRRAGLAVVVHPVDRPRPHGTGARRRDRDVERDRFVLPVKVLLDPRALDRIGRVEVRAPRRERGSEEAADRLRSGNRRIPRAEARARPDERAVVRAGIEPCDLVRLRGHEVVAEARVEVLDHRHLAGQSGRLRRCGCRLRVHDALSATAGRAKRKCRKRLRRRPDDRSQLLRRKARRQREHEARDAGNHRRREARPAAGADRVRSRHRLPCVEQHVDETPGPAPVTAGRSDVDAGPVVRVGRPVTGV